jgi:RNA polymerase sigma-70 factor (ECF subfamily)
VGDEAELVERLRSGDEAAFAALIRQYHPSLVRLARSFVGSTAVAEEVAQDTWLAVVRGVDRFEGRASFKTWLFRILSNRARTTAGKERRVEPLPDDDPTERFTVEGAWAIPPVPWTDMVDDRLTAERLVPWVRDALGSLPDAQRQVLLLRDVEGLSGREVAELLDLTDSNQRVLLHRARTKVRAALDARMGTP